MIDNVIFKVEQCPTYASMYAMESAFNTVGLTIQTTSNNRVVLAKLVEGKVIADSVVDDYIYIGSHAVADNPIPDRMVSKVCDFIRNNSGEPSVINDVPRVWRNGLKMYESTIAIMNEDVDCIVDAIVD